MGDESYKYDKNGELLQKHKPLGPRNPAVKDDARSEAAGRALELHMEREAERAVRADKRRKEPQQIVSSPSQTMEYYLAEILERLDHLIKLKSK
jgi:hypothetical protein